MTADQRIDGYVKQLDEALQGIDTRTAVITLGLLMANPIPDSERRVAAERVFARLDGQLREWSQRTKA